MPSAPMAFMRPKPRRVAFFSRKSWPERHFSASVRARRNGSFAPKPALPTCWSAWYSVRSSASAKSCRPIQASEFVSALSKPHQLRHAIMSVGSASRPSFVYATSARERVESRGSPASVPAAPAADTLKPRRRSIFSTITAQRRLGTTTQVLASRASSWPSSSLRSSP